MAKQFKFEAVFGNQNFFKNAPEHATAVWVDESGYNFYYKQDETGLYSFDGEWNDCLNVYDDIAFSAMRRIIKTPVWTKADQEAGRLPDVGVTVIAIEYEEECKVVVINNDAVCVVFDDGEFITLHVSGISPIEKPEEHAEREREEWCNSAAKLLKNLEYSSTLTSIYDALLSGELKMPEVQ